MVQISDMHELAKSIGLKRTGVIGRCLSNEYINTSTHLEWQCGKCNHIWMARPKDVKRGTWCAKCAGNLQFTIEDMQELARVRGIEDTGKPGKCLSEEYIRCESHLKWECGSCEYVWKTTPRTVKRGHWCPNCSTSKMERKSRQIIQSLFNRKFPTIRPQWLKNPYTNKCMHLDGFNKNLRIAFEYNGKQHYKYVKFFHRTYQEYFNLRYRDSVKRRLCRENGIILIVIPYTLTPDQIKQHIVKEYERQKSEF